MALRAQSTGPSCKLNNVAPSTDMYRVSGQAQTSSPRTRFLYLRIFHPTPIPALSRRLSPSLHRPTALILFSLHEDRDTECLRVAGIDSRQLYSHCTHPWPVIGLENSFDIPFYDFWIVESGLLDLFSLRNFITLASFLFLLFFLRKIKGFFNVKQLLFLETLSYKRI